MNDVHMFARAADGTETDITEGVQALYDLVISSTNWGSGFLSAEDARPVALLARVCGFEQAEEAERYLREQEHSEQQAEFLRKHADAERAGLMSSVVPDHDHVFSSAGRCMWRFCYATESLPSGAS
jgi:hypothetical protein